MRTWQWESTRPGNVGIMEEVSKAGKDERGVAVIDVCDTLYFSNTTHDFVDFVIEQDGAKGKFLYGVLTSRYSPLRYVFIAFSVFAGWDYLRNFKIRMLKGRTRKEVDGLAAKFVSEFLQERKIAATHALIEEYREKENGHIILCSSSIEPVVAAVANSLGIDEFVCTTLELEHDVYTGSIDKDVSREKLKNLEEAGVKAPICLAISDNLSDLELLKVARDPIAVAHSDRKKEFWTKHQIKSLDPKA